MKEKKSFRKLFLKRQTIASLNRNEMKSLHGLGDTCPKAWQRKSNPIVCTDANSSELKTCESMQSNYNDYIGCA